MTTKTHLTNDLQDELNKIGSTVRLETENNSVITMNYKDWAWAIVKSRSIQVSTFVGLDDKLLQLEDSEITACSFSTNDIIEIATIIDKWLGKELDIFQLKYQYKSININKTYQELKTLTVDEILQHRWNYFSEEIVKGRISFRQEVFEEFKKHFSYLYPIFSHDNLLFSIVIEQINDDFKSPIVFCDEDIIWVGFFIDNSEQEGRNTFKTKDIEQAIEMTNKLLPKDISRTRNPLTKLSSR